MHPNDLRLASFLSDRTEVFHSIQHRHEIWREDPFDVETVHQGARATFERLLLRATTPPGLDSGRILLLLGDSGCGKTHLLRAFRTLAHERSLGFVGYMQMTTSTSNYGRYVLSNLIDSLDQPYHESTESRSGLRKLSDLLLSHCGKVAALLANPEQDAEDIPHLVETAADDLQKQERFKKLDLDLLRALLFLQRDDTRIRSRVLKYLRCEDLSGNDRKVLGELVPRIHDNHPQEMVEHLGQLSAVLGHSLVLCVDQLEGFDIEASNAQAFRRAMHLLCDFAERAPSSVIVISCLHTFWTGLRGQLTQSLLDRIERDPDTLKLENLRTAEEARLITERRLEHLYAVENAPFDPAEPAFPFPHEGFEKLAGLSTREVLDACRLWREQANRTGALPEHFPLQASVSQKKSHAKDDERKVLELDQLWNDFRSTHSTPPPEEDSQLAELLVWALRTSAEEVETGHRFEARRVGESIQVDVSPGDEKLHLALCNKGTQRGGLANQIEQTRKEARGRTPVVIRTSDFPSNPKTTTAVNLGKLISKGGRRAVLEDSDSRALLSLRNFRQQHESRPDFASWLRSAKPLTQLKPLRDILDLDHLRSKTSLETRPPETQVIPPAKDTPEKASTPRQQVAPTDVPKIKLPEPPIKPPETVTSRSAQRSAVRIGEEESLLREPVLLSPNELTQHAAFLGGPGSGKTTLALNVIEQLLLQGIPAILVDRKGDLAGYASEAFWTRPLEDARRTERRALLQERLDVALFTPGHPNGRPLAIPIVPEGLNTLPEFDRQQGTRHAAEALAGMLDYRNSPKDKSCRTLLTQAIDQFIQLSSEDVTLPRLVRFIGDKDPRLVNAAGRLDTKLFDKVADDLDRLNLDARLLLGRDAEKLDMDLLLGRGAHAKPGKTRLSILSTKFLGDNNNVLFWVSQLLIDVTRWLSRNPSPGLQAVLMFDEADMYLPAMRQPSTKQPLENLIKRARSAGLGLLLATQSPGDFDYKCRDNIRSWFIGRVKERTSLEKMKPMLSEARVDFTSKIPGQGTGEFHVVRSGKVERVKTEPSALATEQLSDDELLRLAARTAPVSPVAPTGS
ncbi:type IV secretion system DNA-binding domain-containing protein [Stigmatella sp. ncwal1]|uniref:Type IV secretion system DNA-binding domain-containing protein n=1 Tax=Stigmatella ashevillensis TaxID=2995309 RepID=A0ABT5D1D8_9BACT|nr:type IV secretion system DNA-binding domain-containing protein [Stigmatella ashevillena]MDC0707479.1 type IV secretion system DNA-binding domain-containing protein [Stigmatella ashevillena]